MMLNKNIKYASPVSEKPRTSSGDNQWSMPKNAVPVADGDLPPIPDDLLEDNTGASQVPAGNRTPSAEEFEPPVNGETPAPEGTNPQANQQSDSQTQSKLTFEAINDLLALTDEKTNNKQNCQNYKISVFFVFKPIIENKMFNPDQVIWLEYPKNITQIILEDNLKTIGFKGYMDIKNDGSQFDTFLNRSNLFYVVMNITEYDASGEPIVKYEPYIFDISYIQTLSLPTEKQQILRVGLVDIITSILSQHSFPSVIRFNESIEESKSYKEVYEHIFYYVQDYIKTSFNYKYEYKKKLLFNHGEKFLGKHITGHESNLNLLIRDTLKKIPPNSTIMEALEIISRDSCTALKTPEYFNTIYDGIGDVLIPFFFKEELPDPMFVYTSCVQQESKESGENSKPTNFWDQVKQITKNFKEPLEYNPVYGGKSPMLLYRQMTMRDIYLPFFLAFGSEKYMGIYENINPSKEEEKMLSLNGTYRGNVYEMTYNPVTLNDMSKLWKNVIFLNCSKGSTSASSVLIFFSWFYDFFTNVFLNESVYNGVPKKLTPNVTPAFHAQMAAHNIPHYQGNGIAKKQEGKDSKKQEGNFVSRIDEHNSYTYASTSNDTINECLWVMGKNVASFVLVNDSYKFTIRGSLRRRPNEIIKYWFNPIAEDGSEHNLTISTDIGMSNYTYMYVSQVIHKFIGNEYHNTIRAYKFADVFQED